MKKNGKDSRPGLPPIRKIEVSEEQKGLRIALAAVFLAIGAVAIIIGLVSAEHGAGLAGGGDQRQRRQLRRGVRADVRFFRRGGFGVGGE